MTVERSSRPTPKMVRLYHRVIELYGSEPEDLWVFDPSEMDTPPPYLRMTHVPVWLANQTCEVTTFQTLGMSERKMNGAEYFAELHLAYRGLPDEPHRLEMARFLANIATYPFHHDLKLDWWELIPNPGRIPLFPACSHLLLHPKLSEEGFDELDDSDGTIKIIYLVPITTFERHLLVEHGRESFIAHLAEKQIDILHNRMEASE